MAIEIVDLPIKDGGSFHSYVSLPEGNQWLMWQFMCKKDRPEVWLSRCSLLAFVLHCWEIPELNGGFSGTKTSVNRLISHDIPCLVEEIPFLILPECSFLG